MELGEKGKGNGWWPAVIKDGGWDIRSEEEYTLV